MRKAIYFALFLFIATHVIILIKPTKYRSNENDIPEDLGDSLIAPKKDTFKFLKPDTTPYKGNWIDIN